ncbi:rhodanese-like domain-containing protein [Halorubellus salinus]|uniref:rhodanese-like domain-containing protein n=1 Tax=Halorubellus salinus TaxID=755309 RepID=UPI001D089DD8|nr:rhodanese-like domain-containing protein [Halorubellus salinus]
MDGEVAPEDVEELTADDDVDLCIVDIRNPSSYARGHIPGSRNVPLPELTNAVEALPDADRVVTVCPHGKSSVQAARLIASYEGVDAPVESMAGGLTAYDGEFATGTTDGNGRSADAGGESTDGPSAPF